MPAADVAPALSDSELISSVSPAEPRVVQAIPSPESNGGPVGEPSVTALRIVGSLRSTPAPALALELVVALVEPPNEPVENPIRVPLPSADTIDVVLPSSALAALFDGRELRIWAENAGRRTKRHDARFDHGVLRRARDEGSEYRIDVDLEFLRLSTVSGSVIEATGSPMAGATVAVFAFAADGEAPALLATQPSREDGSFLFELESCGRIAVAAHFEGFTAATREADLPCERQIELPPLRLTSGVCIRGAVRTNDRDRSIAGLSVRVRPVDAFDSSGQVFVGQRSFQWTSIGLQPHYRSTKTDDQGEFEYCGLLPGSYSVYVDGSSSGCSLPAAGTSIVVTAPVEGVVLEIAHPLVRFSVTHDGQPVFGAFVSLRPTEPVFKCLTNHSGLVEIGVPPGVAYTAEVGAEGLETTAIGVAPLASGEVRLEKVALKKLTSGGTLKLSIEAQTREPIERACVVLERVRDGVPVLESTRFLDPRVIDDLVTLANIPPDRYRVAVRATHCHNLRTMLAPEVFEIDIGAGQTVSRSVSFARGGRVQVRIRNPEGAVLPAWCWVESGDAVRWPLHFTPTPSDGVVELSQALAAGDYTLHCETFGYLPLESSFTVRADEVTKHVVTMTPKR